MSKLRRYNLGLRKTFITSVTFKRLPILVDNADILGESFEFVNTIMRFGIAAWVILPDHFHFIIEPVDKNISEIMRRIKAKFSGLYRSRFKLTEGKLWQNRFWDHVIRDESDLHRHLDYIHYNPVKHGLVTNPFEYKHSSIHEYMDEGFYQSDWGIVEPITKIENAGE